MRPLHNGICGECGVPNIWAKDSVLDGDNTSLQKMLLMRGVFFETEEIERLIAGMESKMGVSLSGITFTAHKKAVRRFFEGTLKGILGGLARKAVPLAIFRQQAKVAPNFGVGVMTVEDYERGGPLVIEAGNVWNERLFAADVAGAFETVERDECEVATERTGDAYRFVARRREGEREEYRGRLTPLTGTLMGTKEYPRCYRCGAPVSFRVFRWDRDSGEIIERDNGLRVVHQTVACIDSLIQEMEEELGEDVRRLAIRVQADYVREKVSSGSYDTGEEPAGDLGVRFFEYLSLIRRRCQGNPLFVDLAGDELKLNVRNPGNEEMLLGRALGTFEAVMGTDGKVESEQSDGTLKIRVTPT